MKKSIWSVLTIAMTAVLFLTGCGLSDSQVAEIPQNSTAAGGPAETAPSTVGGADTVPALTDPASDAGEVTQLRLTYRQGDWWRNFENGDSYFFVAESADGFTQGLRNRGIALDKLDLTPFDDGFFAANRLVVIPRTSNTGSIRYGCQLTAQKDGLLLTVTAESPEYVTGDMADFLVLVPVSLADYPADVDIRVDPAGNPTSSGSKNHIATA